jgi:type II secretory pathway component PulK
MRNDQGSVLVMTTFVIALLSILLTGMMVLLSAEIQLASQDAWARQAGFVAETAIAESMYQLTVNDTWDTGFNNESFGDNQHYSASIINTSPQVTIRAIGSANGISREIEAVIAIVKETSPNQFALRVDSWKELE